MAGGTTSTIAVEDESFRQLNVLIPRQKVEKLNQLKAACGVPLTGLVEACIDLFSLAHQAEEQGGRLVIVSADGTERFEVQLPRRDVRTVPVKPGQGGNTEVQSRR
jgi:hypothetical protein